MSVSRILSSWEAGPTTRNRRELAKPVILFVFFYSFDRSYQISCCEDIHQKGGFPTFMGPKS